MKTDEFDARATAIIYRFLNFYNMKGIIMTIVVSGIVYVFWVTWEKIQSKKNKKDD